ncbi:ABC-2 family transporter protein [Polystyrenella longa]|uniref:ABC-2 family transporter protein n=1 Tax=Polystyrenella longa TaxID=2528007 RepID=A0A518CHY4_9PLAN|nr:hypothetical protein [Polystyrenella longa]QDU78784.1 ABC-2 family transporter protein [Polystyrenella longa]
MIDKLRNRFSLPLLARDLTQQAGRRSLYVVRTSLVIGMIIWIWLATDTLSRLGPNGLQSISNLGSGRELFQSLVWTLFIGIYIFVPILSCGSIAQEKENDSLQLLLLTRLGPWSIIMEKYLSRVFPMLLYLFCALPIFAYLYSLGGITEDHIFTSFYMLTLAILQLNALCLACSAASSKTISALVLSVVVACLFYLTPSILGEIFHVMTSGFLNRYWTGLSTIILFPPALQEVSYQGDLLIVFASLFDKWPMLSLVVASIPIWISTLIFLYLARILLLRRATVKSRNWLYIFFEKLDRLFNEWNEDVTGGIVLIKDRNDLPGYEPISWKETRKTSVGTARYLIRVLVVLELPVIFICLFLIMEGVRNASVFYPVMLIMLGIAQLILINKSTGLITQERMQQTLEVILATPLSGRDIILQKSRGVLKLWIVVMIPIMTLIISKTLILSPSVQFTYLLLSTAVVISTTYLSIWLSILIGLKQKRHLYAVTITLSIIGLWAISSSLIGLFVGLNPNGNILNSLYVAISPLSVLRLIDTFGSIQVGWEMYGFGVVIGYLLYVVATAGLIRHICLSRADELLGRITADPNDIGRISSHSLSKPVDEPTLA